MLNQFTRWMPAMNTQTRKISHQLVAIFILIAVLAGGCTTTRDRKAPVSKVQPTTDLVVLHQRAVSLMQQERWHEAVESLETITARQDELSGPWLNLGIAYSKSGDSASAETAFRKSIEMNTMNIEAYNQLGILYRRTGRLEKAGSIYESALAIDPDNTNIHWNLGILHDRYLPDPRKALLHYQRYQQLTGSDDMQLQAWIDNLANNSSENNLASKVAP